jgi:hypothetical protein
MDYQDDVKYQQVCQQAVKKDIIINTVQCGNNSRATPIWKEIAKLAEGDYVAIAQSGGVASISTPVDKEIALLNRELGGTVVAYGDASARRIVTEKSALADEATAEVAADRLSVLSLKSKAYSSFSGAAVAPGSIAVVDGDGDLIQSLASGKIGYDKIDDKKLSSKLKKMSAKDREKYLKEQVAKRQELQKRLEELLVKRRDYVSAEKEKLKKEGKADGFDAKVSEIISKRRK